METRNERKKRERERVREIYVFEVLLVKYVYPKIYIAQWAIRFKRFASIREVNIFQYCYQKAFASTKKQ